MPFKHTEQLPLLPPPLFGAETGAFVNASPEVVETGGFPALPHTQLSSCLSMAGAQPVLDVPDLPLLPDDGCQPVIESDAEGFPALPHTQLSS